MNPFHLHSKKLVTRDQVTTRLYALSETDMPKGNGMPESLIEIVEFLDPERSKRYGPTAKLNHVFAYDFCYLSGAYLPRIWYSDIANEDGPKVEMTTASIFDWLQNDGVSFGWKEIDSISYAQELANLGHVVTVVGLPKDIKREGMMTMVIPGEKLTQCRAGKNKLTADWYNNSAYGLYKIFVNLLK